MKHKIEVSSLWWKETLMQPQVKENEQVKLMWEIPIQTDVTVMHNRPDLIYVDKIKNITFLIDISVPSDYNIGAKEIEKLSKYHLLKTEIRRLWNTQTTVIPIVIGATGVISKSLNRYIDQLNTVIDVTILQKQASIHTTTILSKVLGDTVFVSGTPSTQEPTPEAQQTSQQSHTQQQTHNAASQQSSSTQHSYTSHTPNTQNPASNTQSTTNTLRRGKRRKT